MLVSDLDLECKMWLKLRLAPLPPYIGAVSLGFLSPPMIKVQLSPYGKVQLMRIPIIQASALVVAVGWGLVGGNHWVVWL